MSEFLSEEWVADYATAGAALPKLAGASAAIQYIVSEAPAGKVRWFEVIEDGQITQAELGKHAAPEITITWKTPAALAIYSGDVSGDESFMQGRTKVEGDYVQWLIALREWRRSEPVMTMLAERA